MLPYLKEDRPLASCSRNQYQAAIEAETGSAEHTIHHGSACCRYCLLGTTRVWARYLHVYIKICSKALSGSKQKQPRSGQMIGVSARATAGSNSLAHAESGPDVVQRPVAFTCLISKRGAYNMTLLSCPRVPHQDGHGYITPTGSLG